MNIYPKLIAQIRIEVFLFVVFLFLLVLLTIDRLVIGFRLVIDHPLTSCAALWVVIVVLVPVFVLIAFRVFSFVFSMSTMPVYRPFKI